MENLGLLVDRQGSPTTTFRRRQIGEMESESVIYLTVTSKVDLNSSLLPIQRVFSHKSILRMRNGCSSSLGPAGVGSVVASDGAIAISM